MQAVHRLGTILGVWAHPDDETYPSAGLMAAAVAAGQRVVLVHATRGESGTSDPARSGRSFAALRERELAAARAVLGVTEQRFLGYEDGRCSAIPLGKGTRAVADDHRGGRAGHDRHVRPRRHHRSPRSPHGVGLDDGGMARK